MGSRALQAEGSHDTEYNPAVLHDLVFWSRVLTQGSESSFRIFLAAQEDSPAIAEGESWLELSALVPTVVFQEPADASISTAVPTEMSEVEILELQLEIEQLISSADESAPIDGNAATSEP